MKKIYILNTYTYDTFSYSGIAAQEIYAHATRQSAEIHARDMGLNIVEYCEDPEKECTIDELAIYEME